ncbi:MAG: WYL domain-containing protein [Actinomycetota bacterium]
MLDGFDHHLPDPAQWAPTRPQRGPVQRARIRISPQGRQLAAVLRVLQPLRVTREALDDDGWMQATFRIFTIDAAATDVLSLSPHVEVLEPPSLRRNVAERLRRGAALYEP